MPRFFRKKKPVKPKLQTFTKKHHLLLKRRLKLIRKPEILSDAWDDLIISGLSLLVSDYLTSRFDGVDFHCVFGVFDTSTGSETHRFMRCLGTSLTSSRSSLRQPEPHGLHVPITAIINPTSDLNGSNGVNQCWRWVNCISKILES